MLKRGKIATDKQILNVRPLARGDLDLLKETRQLPVITRLRDPHHLLAKLLASGLRATDAALRSGYSLNRVMQLQADPTFKDLVESYRGIVTSAFAEQAETFMELAHANMIKAERMIAEKLERAEEEDELLPTKDLLAISRDAADRTGYGKKQTNVNVNIDFAAKLERAAARSRRVLEGDFVASPQAVSESARVLPSPDGQGERRSETVPLRRRA